MFDEATALGSTEREAGEDRGGKRKEGREGGRYSREKQIMNKLKSHFVEAGFKIHFILELETTGSHLILNHSLYCIWRTGLHQESLTRRVLSLMALA